MADPDADPSAVGITGVDPLGAAAALPLVPIAGVAGALDNALGGVLGQTSQSIFGAVLGPIAEIVLTAILAAGGVALIVFAIAKAATATDTGRAVIGTGLKAAAL